MSGFIRETREQFHVTVILIEHDIGGVMGLSDRVTVLDYRRKIAEGAPEAVQSDQAVIDAYLDVAHSENSAESDVLGGFDYLFFIEVLTGGLLSGVMYSLFAIGSF